MDQRRRTVRGVIAPFDRHDVFLLGSGFSAAATAGAMPVTAGLADAVVSFLESRPIPLAVHGGLNLLDGGDVEGFLSYLASPQPFLSDGDVLENLGTFRNLTGYLWDYLAHHQDVAQAGEVADWLGSLVGAWHALRSDVLTLNYDTLVESAARGLPTRKSTLEAEAVLAKPVRYAVPNDEGQTQSPSWVETFALHKLHGSLSWYFPGSHARGQPILDIGFYPYWGPPITNTEYLISRVPGMVPFITPPTFTKDGYFDHELIRALWMGAASALTVARRVFVMGYSLPEGDTTMRLLLSSAIQSGAGVVVVDPDAEVAERVQKAIPQAEVSAVVSDGPIPQVVASCLGSADSNPS